MTDTASDITGNEYPDSPEDASKPETFSENFPGEEPAVYAASGEDTPVTDEPSIQIMEPQGAGTLFVAVAEPQGLAERAAEVPEYAGDAAAAASLRDIPRYGDLADVAAVRLNGLGPALFFTVNGLAVAAGDKVLVSMEEGLVFGAVAGVMRMNPSHLEAGDKLSPLVRKATEKDLVVAEENEALATEALGYCRECVRERNLDMKLVDVLILHDRGKLVFYFTAPARIDFRELVKDLVRRYRTRIELRQIGVRHETQMVGALGNCGMVCCCRRYLRKFAPVAIKMAKEQNVFLNPVKISGICGRLLCCLAYEQEHYDEFYRSCPKLGKKYQTDTGVVRILRASLFRESVTVLTDAGEEMEYPLTEWNALNPHRPSAGQLPPKKPEPQSARPGDDRPRKNERNGQSRPWREEGQGGQTPVPAVVKTEELIVVTEASQILAKGDGEVVLSARSEITVLSVTTNVDALDTDDDAAADDGGSIFGLAPRRRDPADSEGQTPSFDRNSGQADGGRKKRPARRRKPRSNS